MDRNEQGSRRSPAIGNEAIARQTAVEKYTAAKNKLKELQKEYKNTLNQLEEAGSWLKTYATKKKVRFAYTLTMPKEEPEEEEERSRKSARLNNVRSSDPKGNQK